MISVLFSTYNRADSLARTLSSFLQVTPPAGGWEIVVVDNRSKDRTPEVLDEFSRKLPLTALKEPRPGKVPALQTGIAATRGDLVFFTDDDVLVEPDALTSYEALAAKHPECDIFGGEVLPLWPVEPPRWAVADPMICSVTFSVTTATDPPATLGTNFAVRGDVARLWMPRIDPDIGPNGTSTYPMGSENAFILALEGAGHRSHWDASPKVHHVVRLEQMDPEWVLKRAVRQGRGAFRMGAGGKPRPAMLFGAARFTLRQWARQSLRFAWARVSASEEERFRQHWKLRYYWGCVLESRAMFGD